MAARAARRDDPGSNLNDLGSMGLLRFLGFKPSYRAPASPVALPSGTPARAADAPGRDAAGGDEAGRDAPGHDAPGHDAPGNDAPGNDAPGNDAPGNDAPGNDAPGHDAPGNDARRRAAPAISGRLGGHELALHLAAKGVPVRATQLRFPHVVDKLAAAWDDPRRLDAVFVELLVDHRGGRQGFPLEVIAELTAVRVLCRDWRHDRPADPWDNT